MHTSSFRYDGAALLCDGVPLADIARVEGTPVYVYSAAAIQRAYAALDEAFAAYPHRLHYALKANSSLGILRLLHRLGSGVDANSVGEIEVAQRAGFAADDIVFTGVGKRDDEIEAAVCLGVHAINVESAGEVERVTRAARARQASVRIAIRVNPDVDAGSHPYITTGVSSSKFGVPASEVRDLARGIARSAGLSLVGLHVHVGSQILKLDPLRRAAETIVGLASEIRADGLHLEHLDLGGGLGVPYDDSVGITPTEYADAVLPIVARSGLRLLLEPGRVVVAQAGVLLTSVLDVKSNGAGRRLAVVDAGMTELLRPALYRAYHRIEPVSRRPVAGDPCEIVGPLCETSDTFGEPRLLPPLKPGDVLAIRDTGAYGAVMASNYNRRPFAPEVLVEGDRWRTIRRRQTIDDLIRLEA